MAFNIIYKISDKNMTTSNTTNTILIKDLKPGMNNLHLTFIVLEICPPTTTKENQVI